MTSRSLLTHKSRLEQRAIAFRLRLAVALLLLAFVALTSRLVYLQLFKRDYYTTRAEYNRISVIPNVPQRGSIIDRNGHLLARNYSALSVELTPGRVKNLEALITQLSGFIKISPHDLKRFGRLRASHNRFESIPLRTHLSDEEAARFAANHYLFPKAELKTRVFREYPLGSTAAHVVGYIGRINERDLKKIDARPGEKSNYRGTERIGKSGLERYYEFDLHGKAGHRSVEIDANGRVQHLLSHTPSSAGDTLELTLDAGLQQTVERAFGKRRGSLVAIDPRNGDMLAMVSMPSYDPNLFAKGISAKDWRALNESPDKPLLNRSIRGIYPPGSTFKPFMAMAALELGWRTPEQSIVDKGFFKFGNHVFRDERAGGHGRVNMHKSIVESCDTYYYLLANEMGIDNIAKFMRSLGFGQRTGVDLEYESKGVLPSPEWKHKRFGKSWIAGETISIGIGQGYNAYTPIQLAHAVATLANGGIIHTPRLLRRKISAGVIYPAKRPEPVRLSWQQKHVDVVKAAMVDVNKIGTGARAFAGAPYTAAGKTGTTQLFSLKGGVYKEKEVRERLRDHSLFIAYAPADFPKIALAVIVENGGFGARAAAPIARIALDYFLLSKQSSKSASK